MARGFRDIVEEILLSGRAGDRLLSDSAVLMPVWHAMLRSGTRVDLLITPMDAQSAAGLARRLADLEGLDGGLSEILPLEGNLAVKSDVTAFVRGILPATGLDVRTELAAVVAAVRSTPSADGETRTPGPNMNQRRRSTREQADGITIRDMVAYALNPDGRVTPDQRQAIVAAIVVGVDIVRSRGPSANGVFPDAFDLPVELKMFVASDVPPTRSIWRVSLNRPVDPMMLSVQTIKADAAQRVFDLDCREITWAVIDSGIDGSHPAFRDHEAGGFAIRVDKAYDFTRLRRLASYDSLAGDGAAVLAEARAGLGLSADAAGTWLQRLRDDSMQGRPFDWEALSRLLEVRTDVLPPTTGDRTEGHGTHVAGVLGGDWREGDQVVFRGVCPTIRLYDLRVLGSDGESTELAVIGALEFVRWLNGRNGYITIHGVNLSIGLEHDLENYACGHTPVCQQCNRTVRSGVSVVAAAGNWGTRDYESRKGPFRGYAPISIADPGNAEYVITVGSTHRERPHEYGVSFFSSRGPTGDGRAKPDVVAPGERIDGPLPDLGFGKLDGTSMAAPHVSGVAAMLMARYPEMIGDPDAVKARIIETAVDLRRERMFQGAGLVDALEALQGR